MHDDYKPLDLSQFVTAPPNGRVLEPCPVCGSEAGLWQYSESETSPRKLLAMCSHGDKIGPQDGLIHEGCLLYMPGDNFYRETIRDAVRYWNEMARAIVALRNSNAGVTAVAPGQHYPVEWGPSDNRRLTCACGNSDPAHADAPAGVAAVDQAQRAEKRHKASDALDEVVREYLDGYEFRGDGGDHTPTELEAALIADAVAGLIGEDEFVRCLHAWDALRTRPAGVDGPGGGQQ